MDEEYGMKTRRIAMILTICAIILSACAEISPADQPDLEETTWVLMTYNDNHPIEGTQPTLQFEDGQVSGNAGCNHYGGSYQVKGDAISFGALSQTEMACMDPEGVMVQERTYLDLLGSTDRFELVDDVLKLFAGQHQILTFEMGKDSTIASTPTLEHPTLTPATMIVEPMLTPTSKPPVGFKEYQDSVVGISVYIPESWVVTGVIDGQYAIFQSYPEDKYIGGEALEPGDTKCDLFIRNDISADEFISEMRTNQAITIISKDEIMLNTGQTATRVEMESMGHSALVIAEFNERVVVLTCFGDFALVDEIAVTLKAGE